MKTNEPLPSKELDEHDLNPPPRQYRVPFSLKVAFVCCCIFGIVLYAFLIIDRRLNQNRFITHNQLAAIKLVPSSLPDVTVYDPKKKSEIELASVASGNWTLLNIWATWCPPCKEEMPSLELLHQKLQGKLTIVALSVDDNVDAVDEFIATNNPSFVVLWDKSRSVSDRLGIEKYPETFLISPDGLLTTQFSGPRDWSSEHVVDYFSTLATH